MVVEPVERAKRMIERASARSDSGVTLIEVVIAFTVLMVTLIPLSYLFTSTVIQAGQSTNQQTALSIAEQWVETLSNVTPPVNTYGEVAVGSNAAPQGPAANSATVSQSGGYSVPLSLSTPTTLNIGATNTLAAATTVNPQSVIVTTTTGQDTISYTGQTYNASNQITSITGITGWSQQETIANGAAITQSTVAVPTETKGNTQYSLSAEYEWTSVQGTSNGSQPNLCVAGTPQLLRVRMTVAWGPTTDANNVQDSVVIDYPPSGIQTLGFVALQVSGDSAGLDSQGNAWSERVQAPEVTLSGAQSLTIWPDSNGCAFAQVEPGSYTVRLTNATSGILGGAPSNDTYGTPSFVENAAGTVTNHELAQPTSASFSTTVAVGAVSRLTASYDQGSVVSLNYPTVTGTEDATVCPGAGVITCLSTGETGTGTGLTGSAVLTALTTSSSQWTAVTLPTGITRLASVACAGTNRCIGVGYGTSGATIISTPTTTTTFTADTIPTGLSSLSQILCPSSTQCVAIGTTTGGAAVVLSGSVSASADSWTTDAITGTGTIAGLANLTCPSGAGGCIATATSTSPSSGHRSSSPADSAWAGQQAPRIPPE